VYGRPKAPARTRLVGFDDTRTDDARFAAVNWEYVHAVGGAMLMAQTELQQMGDNGLNAPSHSSEIGQKSRSRQDYRILDLNLREQSFE
jgi:hypothetical protein